MSKWFCGLITAAALAVASGPVAAQTNGPYYATPSWDQQLPASSRWIILTNWNNEAVLDRETGLVWQQKPGILPDFGQGAINECLTSSIGGRNGWRLPSAEEAMTLLDPANGNNLFVGSPFTVSGDFWTTSATNPTFAYVLGVPGGLGEARKDTNGPRFWCVRGHQGTQSPQ